MKNIVLAMPLPAGTTHTSDAIQQLQDREQTLRNSKLLERTKPLEVSNENELESPK
jgi:hypothetical protein